MERSWVTLNLPVVLVLENHLPVLGLSFLVCKLRISEGFWIPMLYIYILKGLRNT